MAHRKRRYIINRRDSEVTQTSGEVAAFGEALVAENRPQFQIAFLYGVDGELFETFVDSSPGTGAATVGVDNLASVSTGTGVGGYGVIRTKQFLLYKPGQGGCARFTAIFDDPVALNIQWAGLGSLENKLSIGYNGTSFGVNRRTGGLAEIRTLTVTDATGTGSTDVVLDGTTFNITLAAAASVEERAHDIAAETYAGWRAEAIDDTVVFQASSIGAKSGSYSYSGAGAATFAQTRGGAADGDNWVYQGSFSLDNLDGTGPSGMTINPQTGNVYQISYQWLGFGEITYSVEDPDTGQYIDFHRIDFAGTSTELSLLCPSMQMELVSASLGSTTNVEVKSGSMGAFVQGVEPRHIGKPHAATASVSTSSTSSIPLLSLKPANVFKNRINFAEMHPMILSVATGSSGTKPGVVEVWRTPTLTDTRWTEVSTGNSHVLQDTSATALTGGELVASFGTAGSGNFSVDMRELNTTLNKEDNITVAVRAISGTVDFTVALTWEEDY